MAGSTLSVSRLVRCRAAQPRYVVLLMFALLVLAGLPAQAKSVPYQSCFKRSAANYNLTTVLLQAVAATESNYNPNARSHANAHGLMQIQWPGTARHLGVTRVGQLYQPCNNIELGARYLRELLDRYASDERRALAAYNYGPGRIATTGDIPTGAQKYVDRVFKHRMKLLGGSPKVAEASSRVNVGKNRKNSKKQLIASFSSRLRAQRYARILGEKVPAATFAVHRARLGQHGVMLTSAAGQLSADDRVLLSTLGWHPTP